MIPYGSHYLDEDDIQSVAKLLRSGPLTQGPLIGEFENAICEFVGSKYAVAVSSCTAGLHLACMVADLKPAETVLTSAISFVASANCGSYVGASVDFVDVDPQTINLSTIELERRFKEKSNVRVVIPVHFAGHPCEMGKIHDLAEEYEAKVIEDAAHAFGSTYPNGKRVGSCCYSDMTVFSFHPVKSIAMGEGGVITTNSEELYRRLIRLRSHGINKLDDSFINAENASTGEILNPWYYEMLELGMHYRITDIQCALGLSQLKKIEEIHARRGVLASRYDQYLEDFDYIRPAQAVDRTTSANHIYPVCINFDTLDFSRAELMNRLREKGIGTQVHYIPIPMQPYYQQRGADPTEFPCALNYYSQCLTIPLFFQLTNQDQKHIISVLRSLIG